MEDFSENLTFEKLPAVTWEMYRQIKWQSAQIQSLIEQNEELKKQKHEPVDEWLTIEGLSAYLPDHPKQGTIYQWVFNRRVPYYREHGKLRFLRSDIDNWLRTQRHATKKELVAEATEKLNSKKSKSDE